MKSPDIGTEALRDYYSVVDELVAKEVRICKETLDKPVTKGDVSQITFHKAGSDCVYVFYPAPDEKDKE